MNEATAHEPPPPRMTAQLPPGLVAYRRTPVFTETTLPAALRRRHTTKAGVWGLIVMVEGRLRFRRLDPFLETTLDPACSAVVAPEEPHEVEPIGKVRFFVEFYTAPRPDQL
jgi:tellurite resistance-related uncharacterized protein